MEGEEVWVAETWGAHGEGHRVQGVYDSREAAWEGLKGKVDTLYADGDGFLRGRPRCEEWWYGHRVWAQARPVKVQGRKVPPVTVDDAPPRTAAQEAG